MTSQTIETSEYNELVAAKAERDRLHDLVNTPEVDDFLKGVRIEAAHQVERWGEAHDRKKSAESWFWLVGYLAGKALRAATQQLLPRYQHLKRGGTYEVISVGENENNRGENLVVYRGEDDGRIWVRPAAQFFDGRFIELPAKPNEKALHHCISTAAALFNWHKAIMRDTSGSGRGEDADLKVLEVAGPKDAAEGDDFEVDCYRICFGDEPLILPADAPLHALFDVMGLSPEDEFVAEKMTYSVKELRALREWGN